MSLNWAYKEKKIASPALETSCCANVQSTMVDLETLHGRGAIQTNHASNVKKMNALDAFQTETEQATEQLGLT